MDARTGALAKENYMGYGSLKDVLGIFFIFLIIAIVIFLLLREFNCWYWKINQKMVVLRNVCRHKEAPGVYVKEDGGEYLPMPAEFL